MIVLVCGLSGSGKSYIVDKAKVENIGFVSVKASGLLLAGKLPVSGLDVDALIKNQNFLIEQLLLLHANHGNLVVDGHILIETIEGPQLVPDKFFDQLPISSIVFIDSKPDEILRRKPRVLTRIEEIAALSEIEAANGKRLAAKYELLFKTVTDGDINAFRLALHEAVNKSR